LSFILTGSLGEIRYQVCEVPPGATSCTPPGIVDDGSIYGGPIEVATPSVVKAVSLFYSALGGIMRSQVVSFEVPVKHRVHFLSPNDGDSIAVGSALLVRCGDHRASKFVYQATLDYNGDPSLLTAPRLLPSTHTYEGEATACDTDGPGKIASIQWPYDSKTRITMLAVDDSGATVCDAGTVVYHGTIGDIGE